MNLRESFRFAVAGLTANKMRSLLTTLGIMIGVAAVIVLVAVGKGSGQRITDSISGLGANTLTITSTSTTGGGRSGAGGFGRPGGGGGSVTSGTKTRNNVLSLEDAAALLDQDLAPDIKAVAPVVTASSVTAIWSGASHSVNSFVGTTPSYFTINSESVSAGTEFTLEDVKARRRVALVGKTVAEELAGTDTSSLLDQTVTFNGRTFTVIGILSEKGSSGPTDSDDRVIAPITATQDVLAGYGALSSISVQATSAATAEAAQAQVEQILDSRHQVDSTSGDYTVTNSTTLLDAATESTQTFTVLLGAVAAISLLVGGIGVMNIMLVTVTERTREIGIRKAIGARRGDIVSQFLIEATLLSLFGGLFGVAVGLLGSRLEIVGVQPVVAPYSVALAFGVALLTGLFFGLYPANRAAALRPIDALRYE
ncbi:MAG: ABC transporter permease [Candidatus Nanopelagicales bacterium]